MAEMDEHNIVLSVLSITSQDDLDYWLEAGKGRFLAGPMLPCPMLDDKQRFCFDETGGWPDLDWLEREMASGRVTILGELALNYYGIPPSDPRLEPYYELATKYDVPVLAHTNSGPPPKRGPRRYNGCCPSFDGSMGDPALWRPVLEKFPKLRLVLQHTGFPYPASPGGKVYLEETVALMRDYPQVHADMSVLNSIWDEESHRMGLKRLHDEGLVNRILFATDNNDPGISLGRLAGMDFLSQEERRGILYDNAARFFRIADR